MTNGKYKELSTKVVVPKPTTDTPSFPTVPTPKGSFPFLS